ncbi:MAG: histidine--tRNA ligase [Chloroflexi bacterium HGW-Chloroflexi-10]|nr:MAG: histidine--tRNA ligase [Chloroflexi bacterium HGW-Chloroflexi-10]
MKNMIETVKGTRDFYPEDMSIRIWLYSKMREVSELFGYREYDGPFLEKIDLYAAKSGEELVKEQAFVFQDRGGDYITLRPELTPSLARMIAQRQRELPFPQRWWSFGPFWRYERPQKGRTREFFQWNIDLLGTDSPEGDAELISICATFFQKVGLSSDQVKIFVNNRQLMETVFNELGIPTELKQSVFRLVDRKDKLTPKEWSEFAINQGLSPEQFEGLKIAMADKNLWQRSGELKQLFSTLDLMGVSEYVIFDPQIIRGLDYYTGVVFEARDIDKEGRAILGGGHYGNLVGDVGGDPLPGVGFAMGDVMMRLVLDKYKCIPHFSNTSAQVMVTVFEENLLSASITLAAELRSAGIRTASVNDMSKLQKQLKYADRIGVPIVLIMGPDEIGKNEVTVKNLATRTQENIQRKELVKYLKNCLH